MPINIEKSSCVFINYENIDVSYRQVLYKDAKVEWPAVLGGLNTI